MDERTVDVDQLAALRALRRGFGHVQVLEVVEAELGRALRCPGQSGRPNEEVTPAQL
jgi:hypothetical protein